MSKGENTRKEGKKAAVLSPKEKKAAKQLKKADKNFSIVPGALTCNTGSGLPCRQADPQLSHYPDRMITEKEIILLDIGSHDEVYRLQGKQISGVRLADEKITFKRRPIGRLFHQRCSSTVQDGAPPGRGRERLFMPGLFSFFLLLWGPLFRIAIRGFLLSRILVLHKQDENYCRNRQY